MTDLGDIKRDKLNRDRRANQSASDREFLTAAVTGRDLVGITPSNFKELARRARAAKASFDESVHEILTNAENPRTWFVKYLRTHEQCTWRRIAEVCHDLWDGDWSPPSNQVMGIALCERAARLLDEDPGAEPWN